MSWFQSYGLNPSVFYMCQWDSENISQIFKSFYCQYYSRNHRIKTKTLANGLTSSVRAVRRGWVSGGTNCTMGTASRCWGTFISSVMEGEGEMEEEEEGRVFIRTGIFRALSFTVKSTSLIQVPAVDDSSAWWDLTCLSKRLRSH